METKRTRIEKTLRDGAFPDTKTDITSVIDVIESYLDENDVYVNIDEINNEVQNNSDKTYMIRMYICDRNEPHISHKENIIHKFKNWLLKKKKMGQKEIKQIINNDNSVNKINVTDSKGVNIVQNINNKNENK